MNQKELIYNFRKFRFILKVMLTVFIIKESFPATVDSLPDQLDGWKLLGDVLIYYPDNLYEYIDGAAELYLAYDFEELQVREYVNTNRSSIVVDIYRHRTPLHAYGIYSQEKPFSGNFLQIGAQGYWQELMFNFVKGKYYVKISGSDIPENSEQTLKEFAHKIAHSLEGCNHLPQEISFFPEKNKIINSEKFVAQNFLGYGFLHNAFTAEYRNQDDQFSIFILHGNSSEECRAMLSEYIKQTNMDIKDLSQGTYSIIDPYYGLVSLFWKSKFIVGIMDLADDDLRREYLQLLEKKIKMLIDKERY